MKRLVALHLSNNRVSVINASIVASLPNLQSLILTNNQVKTLSTIDALGGMTNLTTLSLLDNPDIELL